MTRRMPNVPIRFLGSYLMHRACKPKDASVSNAHQTQTLHTAYSTHATELTAVRNHTHSERLKLTRSASRGVTEETCLALGFPVSRHSEGAVAPCAKCAGC
jgi:hypothetical protein